MNLKSGPISTAALAAARRDTEGAAVAERTSPGPTRARRCRRVLVIQNAIPHYRRPFYEELSKHFEVNVLHSGTPDSQRSGLYRERVVRAPKWGPFWWQHGVSREIVRGGYDAVIAMFDLRWLSSLVAMHRFDRRVPWVWWGLDRGSSDIALRAKLRIARRNNPIVFYDERTRERFVGLGLSHAKLFVSNNTFHVPDRVRSFEHPQKNLFLNVGSLEARKENDVTIRVFKSVLEKSGADVYLVMVGEGPERQRLENLVRREGLVGRVRVERPIYDPALLQEHYRTAIASVSFGQAGLAVLQSMAFGVPFVTKETAISGGEKSNIISGVNGIVTADDPRDLEAHLLHLVQDIGFARDLGRRAYDHYSENCSMRTMIEGFLRAIEYARTSGRSARTAA